MKFQSLMVVITAATVLGSGVSLKVHAQENASGGTVYYDFSDEPPIVTPNGSSNNASDDQDDKTADASDSSGQDSLAVPGGGWDDDWLKNQQERARRDKAVIDDLDNMFQTDHLWRDGSAFKEDVQRTTGAYIYGGAAAIEATTSIPLTETEFVQEQRDTALYGPEGSPYREYYGDGESQEQQTVDEGFDQLFESILDF